MLGKFRPRILALEGVGEVVVVVVLAFVVVVVWAFVQ